MFAANWISTEIRFLSSVMFVQTSTIIPHVWINYILLVLLALLLIVSLVFWKKGEVAIKRRGLYFLTLAFLASFVLVLWQWNFFVVM